MTTVNSSTDRGLGAWPLVAFPALKLLLHVATIPGYGWFRDEFYYIACSERLDFGYVDHPPLSVLILRIWRAVFGDSIWAIRAVPALAGAATVFLVGLLAREMGGGRLAQALAMLGAIAAPVYLGLNHFYSMNAFDILLWAVAGLIVLRLSRSEDRRLWLVLAAVLGIGLQNKISVLWLGFGVLVGVLATPRRRDLLTPWPWAGAGIALLVFLPHVLWQIAHGWPTLEFIRNATQQKMASVSIGSFLLSQVRMMNLVTAPLWMAGLGWLLFSAAGRKGRALAWVYLAVFGLLAASGSSRPGYLAPAYTWLLAAGGVAFAQWVGRRTWVTVFGLVLVALGGVWRAPFGLPLLPVPTYVAYARAMGVAPATAEKKKLAELPQFYADMHGWDAIVSTVADVFDGLPAGDKPKAAIFTYNYGVAGAMELLGRTRGLPVTLSGHNNYWLWGPRGATGEVVIVVGGDAEGHRKLFEDVTHAATIRCGLCMPYENDNPVFVCRRMKMPIEAVWSQAKHFD